MEVDVCEDRREDASLWGAAVRSVVSPDLHITCLQEGFYEVDEPLIIDLLFQQLHHDLMVDVVKEAFDIHFDQPLDPVPTLCLLERRMAGAVGPKSVGPVGEHWLIDWLQQ